MGMGHGPASLNDFLLESEFWQRLGLDSEAVARLPWRTYRDYRVYIELFCQRAERDRQLQEAQMSKLR